MRRLKFTGPDFRAVVRWKCPPNGLRRARPWRSLGFSAALRAWFFTHLVHARAHSDSRRHRLAHMALSLGHAAPAVLRTWGLGRHPWRASGQLRMVTPCLLQRLDLRIRDRRVVSAASLVAVPTHETTSTMTARRCRRFGAPRGRGCRRLSPAQVQTMATTTRRARCSTCSSFVCHSYWRALRWSLMCSSGAAWS